MEKDKVKIDKNPTHKIKDSIDISRAVPVTFFAATDPAEKDKVKLSERTSAELGLDVGDPMLFSAPAPSAGLSVNSVPEPSSLVIWGTALLCLLPWLRKKFSK